MQENNKIVPSVILLWVTFDNGLYNPRPFLEGAYHFKKSAKDKIKEMKASGTYIDAEYCIETRKIKDLK